MCVQVFGEETADYHFQRVLERVETQSKITARIMSAVAVEFERTQNAH
jgi:hypothetical protein